MAEAKRDGGMNSMWDRSWSSFLFHTDDDGLPTTLSHESAGYFDLGPLDLGENARRDMVLTLEDMDSRSNLHITRRHRHSTK